MPEHQIQNDKTRSAKSGTPTYETVLSDTITKPEIVKRQTQNLEKYFRTMWTAQLRKKYKGAICGNDKREYKTHVMTSLCETQIKWYL